MPDNASVQPEPTPEEWLAFLKGGVDRFNEFREAHPNWRPLFPKNAELRNAKLAHANLRDAYLLGARLSDADLLEADLQNADLLDAHLEGANLVDANLRGASLWWARLDDADLYRAQLQNAKLLSAGLKGANLTEANLEGADLRSAQLQRANLSDARLQSAYLNQVDLQSADLRGARFDNANIIGADFRGARANRASTVLSSRRFGHLCGDNDAADADALMQWAQLYKTHGVFELAGHCYYRARQHYRRERLEGLKPGSPAWWWQRAVNVLETVFLDWSCAYGERPGGVLLWGLIILLFSALIYMFNAPHFTGFDGKPMRQSVITAVYFSTVTFTTLGFGDYHPDPVPFPHDGWWLPLYVAAEAVTGALLLALFLVTFARIMIRD